MLLHLMDMRPSGRILDFQCTDYIVHVVVDHIAADEACFFKLGGGGGVTGEFL